MHSANVSIRIHVHLYSCMSCSLQANSKNILLVSDDSLNVKPTGLTLKEPNRPLFKDPFNTLNNAGLL